MDKKLLLVAAFTAGAPSRHAKPNRPLDTNAAEITREVFRLAQLPWVGSLAARRHIDLNDAIGITCARAIDKMTSFDASRGTLPHWLTTILYRAVEDLGRGRARDGRLGSLTSMKDGRELLVADRSQPIPDYVANKDLIDTLRALLAKESETVRAVYHLHLEEGWTFAEIAEKLGLRRSVVTGRWFAWCRKMRRLLGAEL